MVEKVTSVQLGYQYLAQTTVYLFQYIDTLLGAEIKIICSILVKGKKKNGIIVKNSLQVVG